MDGYVTVDDTRLYWKSVGDGPAVLFLHAGVADSRMWRGQIGLDGLQTIAFDLRGFGKSDWVPGAYADWKDAVAVLDHLAVDSAVIVGCSIGGGIAMHLALAAPDRVDGLVLIGAAAKGWEPVEGWTDLPEWDEAVAAFKTGDLERVLELDGEIWLAGHGRTLDQIDDKLVELFIEVDRSPMATEDERNEHLEVFEPPVNDQLDKINIATLTVVGAHDQPEMIESAEYLATRLSDRPHVVIEGAAHLPSLEKPETFNEVLVDFLGSI